MMNARSDNQGMTSNRTVVEYADELQSGEERHPVYTIYLIWSHILQKTGIGRLSA